MKTKQGIKKSSLPNPYQKACFNLVSTYHYLINQENEFFKPLGITLQQFNILKIVNNVHPQKISGTDIKERLHDKNSDVSRLLDRLVLKKLVKKNKHASDKRAIDISITDKGLSLLTKTEAKYSKNKFLNTLTLKEVAQLNNLLVKSCKA